MPKNGFFGVKNSHFAFCTDEDTLTYETPQHVAGTVAISMEPTVESATSYADNEPWIDKQQDNGGSGTDEDRTSGYDSYSDLDDYETFFDAVDVEGLLEDDEGGSAPAGGGA